VSSSARHSLVLALALFGCSRAEEASAPRRPRVEVTVAAVSSLAPRLPISGLLAPLPGRDVKVGALVAGRVEQMLVGEGDSVKSGQPLARIEAAPLRDRISDADAQQSRARAELDNVRARLVRTEKLWKDGIASRQEVDDLRSAVVAAQSAVAQAAAAGGTASTQLGRATLRAPFDGVVAAILVPAGAPVDGNATPVIEIADTRVLELRAAVPAARIGEVGKDQLAEVVIEGVGTIPGRVVATAPLVDAATNTIVVRVRVENAEHRLRGGLFVRGSLLGTKRDAIAIARSALLPGIGGAADVVAIVGADGKIALRTVVLGVDGGDTVEVKSGIAIGDRVVTQGSYALPVGTEVEVAR